jgi:hypothetical protein
MVHLASRNRSIDWIESTHRILASVLGSQAGAPTPSIRLTEKLAALLLERLPSGVAAQMLELLPKEPSRRMQLSAAADAESSIGFTTFIEAAEQILDTEEPDERLSEDMARICAESFLWAVAQEFPTDLKMLMRQALPTELKSRMNLYLSSSEDSRVA